MCACQAEHTTWPSRAEPTPQPKPVAVTFTATYSQVRAIDQPDTAAQVASKPKLVAADQQLPHGLCPSPAAAHRVASTCCWYVPCGCQAGPCHGVQVNHPHKQQRQLLTLLRLQHHSISVGLSCCSSVLYQLHAGVLTLPAAVQRTPCAAHVLLTLPTLVWPPMTSSLLSCRGVTDQPAAGGGAEADSRGLPSWPDGCAASASTALLGAVQASLLRLYIQMSAR